jgi:hypothetical protein
MQQTIVIVGAGFAGVTLAREPERRLADSTDIVLPGDAPDRLADGTRLQGREPAPGGAGR